MRKILYFHHTGALAGAPLSLLYLIRALPLGQFETAVCSLAAGEVVSHFREHGIRAFVGSKLSDFGHVNGGWYPLTDIKSVLRMLVALGRFPCSVIQTVRIIRRENPDLVHLNSLVLTPQAVGCRLASVPFVWHVREAAQAGHIGFRRAILRWMTRRLPDRVICICHDNAERLKLPATTCRVIYNFVDFAKFDRNLDGLGVRKTLGIPPEKKVILYCGGTNPIKGGNIVPKALEILAGKYPDFVCIVSGHMTPPGLAPRRCARLLARKDTPLVRSLAALRKLERDGFVVITGFRTDIQDLLAACDCLIFPSTMAHFPRPVIEAGAMAKPVIASRLGGVNEVVVDGKTGLLTPPGDAAALVEVLHSLLSDEQHMKRMGEDAWAQARRKFDARRNAHETLAVYREILGE